MPTLEEYYKVSSADMVDVADAIRAKGGTQAALTWPAGWKSAVQAIPSGGGGDVLPSEYQEVQYIKTASNSYTYATLPVVPASGDVIRMRIKRNSYDGNIGLFGMKISFGSADNDPRLEIAVKSNKKAVWSKNNYLEVAFEEAPTVISNANYVFFGDVVTGGDVLTFNALIANFNSNHSFKIFVGAYGTTEYATDLEIRSLTIERSDGNVYCNLIPCYRKADNVVGLYDMIQRCFIVASAGSFTAGPNAT